MLRKISSAILIIISISVIFIVCGKPGQNVAEIGNFKKISMDDISYSLSRGNPLQDMSKFTLASAKFALDRIINNEIIYHEAINDGFDKIEKYNEKFDRGYTKILLTHLYNTQIFDKIITEEELKKFYNNIDRDLTASLIFFGFPKMATEEAVAKVKARADSVYKLIQKGADFVDMVHQYSEDKASVKNNGFIGKFKWTQNKDPMLNTLFSMKVGQISKPTMNRMGYSILRLDSVIPLKNIKPYAEMKPHIISLLRTEFKGDLDDAAAQYWTDLQKKYKLTYDENLMTFWVDSCNTFGQTIGKVRRGLATLDQKALDTILATHSFGTITLNTLKERIGNYSEFDRFYASNAEGLKRYISQWVQEDFLRHQAFDLKIDKLPIVIQQREELYKDMIVEAYTDSVIIGNTNVSDDELEKYFTKNQKNKYTIPEKRTVYEIFLKDEDTALMVNNLLKNGKQFKELAKEFTERRGYQDRNGLLGDIKESNWGPVGIKAFQMKPGEISEPIKLANNSGFAIIQMTKIIPEQDQKLADIKNRVQSDLQAENLRTRKAQWLQNKKSEYPITINEKVLADVFK